MDEQTAQLILEIQQRDVDDFLSSRAVRLRRGALDDSTLAFKLQQDELARNISFLRDRRMGQSISRAIQDDGASISIIQAGRNEIIRDRQYASRLNEDPYLVAENDEDLTIAQAPEEDVLVHLSALNAYGNDYDASEIVQYGQHITAEGVGQGLRGFLHLPDVECVACMESKSSHDMTRAPCSHDYCRICFVQLFRGALIDESLFPPRCCRQEIPLSVARNVLGSELTQQCEQKAIELATPNRTYCSRLGCSTFIPLQSIVSFIATCPQCATTSCANCKRESHQGPCNEYTGDAEVLEMAQTSGWKACHRCHMMIELRSGCNHIT